MAEMLALHGGQPVRASLLPYAKQDVSDADIAAVAEVLRSDWLTTGPKVDEFERAFAGVTGAEHAVAVSNGTAALHVAMLALGIGPGDEVIVPALTFAASSNAVLYCGGTPVFADVSADTLLVGAEQVRRSLTARTKAIVTVDYGGQPCEYDAICELALAHGLPVVADACHALGGSYRGRPVGSLATLNTFSFHPAKHITSGEGGMITTDDDVLAKRMRDFRSHGITTDHRQRAARGAFTYEMVALGYNYRLTDFQSALALSQLSRLPQFIARRRAIAACFDRAFASMAHVEPLAVNSDVAHAYHLYVVRFGAADLCSTRAEIFAALRAENIGANVHYLPVYLHPYYREVVGIKAGICPVAEAAYQQIVSLPMFSAMSDADVNDVIAAVDKVGKALRTAVPSSASSVAAP